ncbi:MAG: S8 family serine peptidase [Mycobacteriales bacterium]
MTAGPWPIGAATLHAVAAFDAPSPITREWAWGGSTGRGVRVAVVDSGIDASHPDIGSLAGGVAVEIDDDAPGGLRLVEGRHDDLFGHGTACAGIIRRLAPDAELFSVRVLGRTLKGTGAALIAGLRWALDHDMDVINLSLSTRRRAYFAKLHDLADHAYFRNTMLVAAMNNAPATSYPAEYSSVFSVGAYRTDDDVDVFYNPAPPVEFGAPGIAVKVAWRDGRTITSTGNSYAAAHVSGLLSRIRAEHPGLTAFQLKTVLHAVCVNATSAGVGQEGANTVGVPAGGGSSGTASTPASAR